MMKLLLPTGILLVLYLHLVAFVLDSAGRLPERVATHFDIAGRPNGWMSRDMATDFTLGVGLFLPALTISMMALTSRIPVSFVNIPNRDYWLAPERRRETGATLLRFGLWLSCLEVLLVTVMHGLIVTANNRADGVRLDGTGIAWALGGFAVGIAFWIVLLRRRFVLPS